MNYYSISMQSPVFVILNIIKAKSRVYKYNNVYLQ